MSNPFEGAVDAIRSIREELSGLSLDTAEFPVINNPLMPSILAPRTIPNIEPRTLPTVNANLINAAGQPNTLNTLSGLTTNQKIDILFGKG